MKKEMTKVKFAGLVVIAGILMWYFCPWFISLVGGDDPAELTPPPPVLKPADMDEV
jgi:hypothetical protein